MKPKLITKADVYSEFPECISVLADVALTKGKKKLKRKARKVIFAVENAGSLIFVNGTSYGYDNRKLCEVYVAEHSSLEFLMNLDEFDSLSLSENYYIFNIPKKFLLRAK